MVAEEKNFKLIIQDAKNGSVEAKEYLINYYSPLISSVVNKFTHRHNLYQHKDDIRQDAVVLFLQFIDNYNPELSNLGYYLKQNFALNFNNKYNKSYVNNNVSLTEYIIDCNDVFSRLELMNDISNAVESLPLKYRIAVKLYYVQELSQAECAAYMDIKQSAFSRLLARAINKLKKQLSM